MMSYEERLRADLFYERAQAMLKLCRTCRHLASVEPVTIYAIAVDQNVHCSKVTPDAREEMVRMAKSPRLCRHYAPKLFLVHRGAA